MPEIVDALRAVLDHRETVLDGEIVELGPDGATELSPRHRLSGLHSDQHRALDGLPRDQDIRRAEGSESRHRPGAPARTWGSIAR
ncbi:hypothetical protein [Rhodococcus sp. NPDC060176]|uniref:hypothetical protein n=1 Tax=Rhodococcus sp. NPDC060176 TaxID=3347062 RepID=UPI00365AD687